MSWILKLRTGHDARKFSRGHCPPEAIELLNIEFCDPCGQNEWLTCLQSEFPVEV
jgi:hypothetical protein